MEKIIIGFNNYSINEYGVIKSLSRVLFNGKINYISKEKILKNRIDRYGYEYISLRKDKKEYKFRIHRLVAMMYLDNFSNKLTVNHIDGNKRNNHYSNLECISLGDNIKHAKNNNLHAYGIKQHNSKLNDILIREIRDKYIPRIVTIKQLSNIYSVSEQVIFDVIHKNTWKHVIQKMK